jgi:hypothetical protein
MPIIAQKNQFADTRNTLTDFTTAAAGGGGLGATLGGLAGLAIGAVVAVALLEMASQADKKINRKKKHLAK